MKKKLSAYLSFLVSLLVIIVFFYPMFLKGYLPIPSDTIVGLYHPFRDLYAANYPRGIPFKNFLITDPVRQLIPWKELVINSFAHGIFPLWNPYEMIGKPLFANLQGGVLYPGNILFLIPNFPIAWSLFIFSQMLLGALFFYLYTKNLRLDSRAIFLGTVAFIFSGFFIAWLEWGNVVSTLIWLPLILLAIDKVTSSVTHKSMKVLAKENIFWSVLFIFSLLSSFFAGHLQIFFYVIVFSFLYSMFKWNESGRNIRAMFLFFVYFAVFGIVSAIQWIPTLQFILLSSRSNDQIFTSPGFFMPLQHLLQFVAPDFFGNPTTLNYWGTWNYAEFVGYVGIIPLIFAIFALFYRHDKKTYFFSASVFVSLFLMIENFVSVLPFSLHLPLISTSQPTRLLSVVTFSLAMLAALGFDYFIKQEQAKCQQFKKIVILFAPFAATFTLLWLYVMRGYKNMFPVPLQDISVAKHNLILPTIIFLFAFSLLFAISKVKLKLVKNIALLLLLFVTVIDLVRFGLKFETFSNPAYFFPQTKITSYLQKDTSIFRVASIDSEILPPDFATHYHIQSIEGYDPLYLLSYAEYVAALERQKPDISPPFGYNRIITPHNINSQLFNLLNTKYVLSLGRIKQKGYDLVLQEGKTKLYKNTQALARTFFVTNVKMARNDQEAADLMFKSDLSKVAVVENVGKNIPVLSMGTATITYYSANKIIIHTKNRGSGFLILADAYYPTWQVKVDNKREKIYKSDLALRGIFVPEGNHTVTFYDTLF